MAWKLSRVKVLERYSSEQSRDYDMKIYAEFVRGFWIFKKSVKFDVYRLNSFFGVTQERWINTKHIGLHHFSYILSNGDYLDQEFARHINDHFEHMYKTRYHRNKQIERVRAIDNLVKK
jgi:hypothetical protein